MHIEDVLERNFNYVAQNNLLGDMLHGAVSKSTRNIFSVIDENETMVGIVLLDNSRESMFDTALYNTTTVATCMSAAPEHISYEKDGMQRIMKNFKTVARRTCSTSKRGKHHRFISKSKLLTALSSPID